MEMPHSLNSTYLPIPRQPSRHTHEPVDPESDEIEPLPHELMGWNWGAFFWSWVWGLRFGIWPGVVALIFPPWAIVAGIKGNEWLWQTGRFDDIEDFQHSQKKWAISGALLFVVISVALTLLGGLSFLYKTTNAISASISILNPTPSYAPTAHVVVPSPTPLPVGSYVLDLTSKAETITMKVNDTVIYSGNSDIDQTGITIPAGVVKEGTNQFTMVLNAANNTGGMSDSQKLNFHIRGTSTTNQHLTFHDTEDLSSLDASELPKTITGEFNPLQNSWNIAN